jgi:hypothetical protein
MDNDNSISNNSTDRSSCQDKHGFLYSQLNLLAASSLTAATTTTTASSVPLSTVSTIDTVRSKKEIENDLFQNIEQLVREFVNRPNRQFPCYRVMRWTTDEQPKIEDFVTVIINQPTRIL